ncbi:MAG: YajG family lipoprotein [Gammaproteobacteria bacterium]
MTTRRCLLLGLAAFVAGCSATPQIMPVVPALEVAADGARGAGRTLAVTVVDARDSDIVGYRDPDDTATAITTPAETLPNIRRALEQGYRELGFTVVPPDSHADIALEVRLTDLGYRRATGGVVRELRTGATLEATSVMPTKTVTAIYHDGQGKDTVLRPSLKANADILNAHLGAALSKLVADARLTTP